MVKFKLCHHIIVEGFLGCLISKILCSNQSRRLMQSQRNIVLAFLPISTNNVSAFILITCPRDSVSRLRNDMAWRTLYLFEHNVRVSLNSRLSPFRTRRKLSLIEL